MELPAAADSLAVMHSVMPCLSSHVAAQTQVAMIDKVELKTCTKAAFSFLGTPIPITCCQDSYAQAVVVAS